jgi:hypothetical protein
MYEKFYKCKRLVMFIKLITMLLIVFLPLDYTLRAMLLFGYFMLFRQERWHKHIFIMLIMTLIMFTASSGFSPIMIK